MSRRFYLYAPQVNQPRLYSVAAQQKKKKEKKKKKWKREKEREREREREREKWRRHFAYSVVFRCNSFCILYLATSRSIFPCIPNPLPISSMCRVCTLAWFIPVEWRQPGLFRSSLPLKLAKEITVARHDFIHGRRGEKRQIVMRLRRLNITVNRARSNSDVGAGATRKHLSRWWDWGYCKTRPIPRI